MTAAALTLLSGAGYRDAAAGSGPRFAYSADTGELSFIGTTPRSPLSRPHALGEDAAPGTVARAFLGQLGPRFGIDDQAHELRVESVHQVAGGQHVVRLQQVHDGVPVLGGELVVDLDAGGNALAVGGEALPATDVSVAPGVATGAAQETALEAVAATEQVALPLLRAAEPALWIYDSRILGGPGDDTPTLVWRVEVSGPWAVDQVVLVDAQRGTVALHYDQLKRVKSRQVCDAGNQPTQAPCSSPIRTEGGAATGNQDADDAYDFAGDVYDFYSTVLGRDSLDGAGLALKSTVRFCTGDPTDGCPWQNAAWSDDLKQMVYGQGFAHADDVVGHELTHGVTASTSKLISFYQAGAIDESMSDVLGELIDLSNGKGTDTPGVRWLLGEDAPGGALRDMESPPTFGDPDRMGSASYYGGSQDNGGIHINNGVGNKAAFLMTDGGTFNGKTVTGIGITKTARIWYQANATLLTSASDYSDLYNALQQSCLNLVATGATTAADCVEVTAALDAVQMNLTRVDPPTPPRNAAATGLGSSATVSWSPPLHGGTIVQYVVTPYTGGVALQSQATAGSAASLLVTGLTNGTPYLFKVKARNSAGLGPEATTNTITPKTSQTITITPVSAKTVGSADFGVTATATSGLPVSLTAAGSCTISGTTVHLTGIGTCSITAAQAGNDSYLAAPPVTISFAVAKGSQSISFSALSGRAIGDSDFRVSASASSGLAVSFAAQGTCTISGTRVHVTRVGTCTITASQAGNDSYEAAPSVSRTFTVAAPACRVPSVTGKTLTAARSAIARSHCRTGTVTYAASKTVKKGKVVSQSRLAGRLVPANTNVNLVVSRGPKKA